MDGKLAPMFYALAQAREIRVFGLADRITKKTQARAAKSAPIACIALILAGCPGTPIQDDQGSAPETYVPTPIAEYPVDICADDSSSPPGEDKAEQRVACGETRVKAKHTPLYSAVPHTSVIRATASNAADGIGKITIYVYRGTMTDCTELGISPSLIPCRTNTTLLAPHVCPIASPTDPEGCELALEIRNGDMITYIAEATPLAGPSVTSSAITYAGGMPSANVAVPVWWHSEFPGAYMNTDRINLALYPDADLVGNLQDYAYHLSKIVRRSFFTQTKLFADDYTQNRHFFDIWAYPFDGATADGEFCDHQFVDSAKVLDGLMHGSVILHKTPFTDCSFIANGGAGTVDVSDYDSDWLLVHESGHFLFGLADEYGQGGQVPASDPPNVFPSLPACEATAAAAGAAADDCKLFGTIVDTYRIRTDEPETMKTRLYTSDFRNTAAEAVSNRLNKCKAGSCYETQ